MKEFLKKYWIYAVGTSLLLLAIVMLGTGIVRAFFPVAYDKTNEGLKILLTDVVRDVVQEENMAIMEELKVYRNYVDIIGDPQQAKNNGLISEIDAVRFVEKTYFKILEKPDDLYVDDISSVVIDYWELIPDSRKNESLKIKYNVIHDKFTEILSRVKS